MTRSPKNVGALPDEAQGVVGDLERYAGDDVDAWSEQWRQWLPAWLVYDFAVMFEMFQIQGMVGSEEDLDDTRETIGAEPRTLTEFARATAAMWQQTSPLQA